MKRVPITELKAKLSEHLEAVKAGEEIIVNERGRPVARVVPVTEIIDEDAWIAELVRTGRARPPLKPLPPDFWDLPRPADPEGLALKALLEEREEGR